MAKTEVAALKEALLAQHQVIRKLHIDLDKEREASESAVSEALSMILRLQGEKATEKMEAHQYKRMAEEKMHHAEESLVVLEELVYHKEMEISSLEFQVQAYRHKLLSFGFSDLGGIGEMEFSKNLPFGGNHSCIDDLGIHKTARRNISLPADQFEGSYSEKDNDEREGPSLLLRPPLDMRKYENGDYEIDVHYRRGSTNQLNNKGNHKNTCEINHKMQDISEESKINGCKSYLDQNEQMDEGELFDRKKKCEGIELEWISENKELGSRTKLDFEGKISCSSSSKAEDSENLSEFDTFSIPCLETEILGNTLHSKSVHDIFEVPQNHDNFGHCEPPKQALQKPGLEDENRLGKPDSVPQAIAEYYFKDETEWIRKALLYTHNEKILSTPRKDIPVDCYWAVVDPKVGVSSTQAEVKQMSKRLQLLEDDRRIMNQELANERKEELKMLRDICEQLKTIKSQINTPKVEKRPPPNDSELVSLMEAMLSFSI